MKRKGISLIVLVITIVVIIILAAAVILSLGDNNPIHNAKKAKIVQSLDNFESDLSIQISNKLLQNSVISINDIDSKNEDGWKITDLIPSIKDTEYESSLVVENGKLRLRKDSILPEKTKIVIQDILGEPVITSSMILENPSEYIGLEVNYIGYSESTNTPDWRIFGLDNAGNIMLKANDYVDLSYKTFDNTKVLLCNNNYCIKGVGNRENLINYLATSSNWSEFAISGTVARGAMTVEEFIKGYNLVHEDSEKLSLEWLKSGLKSSDNSYTANSDGYVVKKGNGNYSESIGNITEIYNEMNFYNSDTTKSYYMWLSSKSARGEIYTMYISNGGYVNSYNYDYVSGGLCPVVSLTSASLVENEDGDLIVK